MLEPSRAIVRFGCISTRNHDNDDAEFKNVENDSVADAVLWQA